jgi:hypothetical protein
MKDLFMRLVPDVVNPLDGLWGRYSQGAMHRFSFATGAGFNGYDVEILLRTYGIRIWGREMSTPEERAFLVKKSQAVWAEYIMCRAGVPLTGPLLDHRNAIYAVEHVEDGMPEPWDKHGIRPSSLVDRIVNWLADIT